MAQEWKGLSDETKAKYNNMAKSEKEQYDKAVKEYKASGAAGLDKSAKKSSKSKSAGKKEKDPNAPKKP